MSRGPSRPLVSQGRSQRHILDTRARNHRLHPERIAPRRHGPHRRDPTWTKLIDFETTLPSAAGPGGKPIHKRLEVRPFYGVPATVTE